MDIVNKSGGSTMKAVCYIINSLTWRHISKQARDILGPDFAETFFTIQGNLQESGRTL